MDENSYAYTVLIMDLKGSRNQENRNNIQRYIISVIDVLNRIFEKGLERKVDFSAGDELQGLFCDTATAYLYFRLLSILLHPIAIRAGIGCGAWDTQIPGHGTTAQDGPVYHLAREAITATSDLEGYSALIHSMKCDDPTINALLSAAMTLSESMSLFQNILLVLSEALCPILLDPYIESFDPKAVIKLLDERNAFAPFPKKGEALSWEPVLQRIDKTSVAPVIPTKETGFFISEGRKSGLPGELADLLGTSRQNVSKAMRAGNITEIRNLSIAALRLMLLKGD